MKPEEFSPAPVEGTISLDAGGAVSDAVFGRRAHKLARMIALGLPVATGTALSFEQVRELAETGHMPGLPGLDAPGRLLVLRSSPEQRGWGGSPALAGIGLNDAGLKTLSVKFGEEIALNQYARFIADFAHIVHRLDHSAFEEVEARGAARIKALLARFAELAGEDFPQSPEVQLAQAARAMARAWNTPTARLVRQAKGAPEIAGLGLIIQEMTPVFGPELNGIGHYQQVDSATGIPGCIGSFHRQDMAGGRIEEILVSELDPEHVAALDRAALTLTDALGDLYAIEFALFAGKLAILDAMPVRRNARSSVRIAVELARKGVITRARALLQIEPRSLVEHLHPQVAPGAARDVFATGIAASPGAATGRIVFTAEDAQAASARGESAILVRAETGPEDIRGMHSAAGVLTIRGGMTSHAAVIAYGIGLPCVVGASGLRIDLAARTLTAADGRTLGEDDLVTLDGTRGEVLAGKTAMISPELTGALSELLDWADAARDIGVRANADTPAEARAAREFRTDGIGLCRTEHMFFDESRITTMREMILAGTAEERQERLDRLLPMQRADFAEIFEIMRGLPVTIRLLDPPLHEFLPTGPEEMAEFAQSMGLPEAQIIARSRELFEVNPMLGMRGVRLGVVMPEIYDMQARAIFEAAVAVNRDAHAPVVPEVMIPLVSAYRESELVKERVDAIAASVRREQGVEFDFKIGIMVETPRAALRSGDLAATSAFLSFGTNDLTQMTYGLSRDDAGRFMRDYVNQGVFDEDPFLSLDVEGVGELLLMASRRGRARNPGLTLGLCGEHGGDPSSIRFCKLAGFDYVSCSPFRVPIARLAAAQATLLAKSGPGPDETP